MKKCLHIGLSATPGTNNGLQKALRKVCDYREIHTSDPNLNARIFEECQAFRPDIVFMQIQTPNIVKPITMERIRPFVGKIINFTGDVREPVPDWYIDLGKHIDLTLFVSGDNVLEAKSRGINADWIQIGFDPEIFNDQVVPEQTADIVFMANNYSQFPLSAYRYEIAHALHKEFGSRFQLFGSGWDIPAQDCNESQERQAAILRGCKIAISCSNFDHSKYVSDRVLRIMGAGAFCLSHEFKDREELYDRHNNMTFFNSINEMVKLCHAYLYRDDLRNRLARNGYELTHKLYTWEAMINNILELCK